LEAAKTGTPMTFKEYDKNQKTELYGSYWTAASIINDAALTVNGKVWPKNWYNGHKGLMTLRKSVEQSVNVNAVRVFQQVGVKYAVSQLKKFGISTVVTSSDNGVNDMNIAALALGGMSQGVSPLEMSSAFGTFPNEGEYIEPICYTKITNKNDEILIQKTSKKEQVIDKGVAFIMTDILRTTVTNGIAGRAATGNQPVGGKTGTTTDNYDAWFCGFTPQYSAALWIGNDVNIELSLGSSSAARLWSKIMHDVCAGMSGSFPSAPSNVIRSDVSGTSEYYIDGTQKGVVKMPKEVSVKVCTESGYLATPWCTDTKTLKTTSDDVHAMYYCYLHNLNVKKYPIDPDQTLDTDFVYVDPDKDTTTDTDTDN
jgi:penicillin-binding protein 1A